MSQLQSKTSITNNEFTIYPIVEDFLKTIGCTKTKQRYTLMDDWSSISTKQEVDVIGIKNADKGFSKLISVEVKRHMSWDAIGKALRNLQFSHYSYIAILTEHEIKTNYLIVAKNVGIGVLEVHQNKDTKYQISILVKPKLSEILQMNLMTKVMKNLDSNIEVILTEETFREFLKGVDDVTDNYKLDILYAIKTIMTPILTDKRYGKTTDKVILSKETNYSITTIDKIIDIYNTIIHLLNERGYIITVT